MFCFHNDNLKATLNSEKRKDNSLCKYLHNTTSKVNKYLQTYLIFVNAIKKLIAHKTDCQMQIPHFIIRKETLNCQDTTFTHCDTFYKLNND